MEGEVVKIQAFLRGTLTRKRLKRDPKFAKLYGLSKKGEVGVYDRETIDDFGRNDLILVSHRRYEERKRMRESSRTGEERLEALFTLQSDEEVSKERSQVMSDRLASLSASSDEENYGHRKEDVKDKRRIQPLQVNKDTKPSLGIENEEGEKRGEGLEEPNFEPEIEEKADLPREIESVGPDMAVSQEKQADIQPPDTEIEATGSIPPTSTDYLPENTGIETHLQVFAGPELKLPDIEEEKSEIIENGEGNIEKNGELQVIEKEIEESHPDTGGNPTKEEEVKPEMKEKQDEIEGKESEIEGLEAEKESAKPEVQVAVDVPALEPRPETDMEPQPLPDAHTPSPLPTPPSDSAPIAGPTKEEEPVIITRDVSTPEVETTSLVVSIPQIPRDVAGDMESDEPVFALIPAITVPEEPKNTVIIIDKTEGFTKNQEIIETEEKPAPGISPLITDIEKQMKVGDDQKGEGSGTTPKIESVDLSEELKVETGAEVLRQDEAATVNEERKEGESEKKGEGMEMEGGYGEKGGKQDEWGEVGGKTEEKPIEKEEIKAEKEEIQVEKKEIPIETEKKPIEKEEIKAEKEEKPIEKEEIKVEKEEIYGKVGDKIEVNPIEEQEIKTDAEFKVNETPKASEEVWKKPIARTLSKPLNSPNPERGDLNPSTAAPPLPSETIHIPQPVTIPEIKESTIQADPPESSDSHTVIKTDQPTFRVANGQRPSLKQPAVQRRSEAKLSPQTLESMQHSYRTPSFPESLKTSSRDVDGRSQIQSPAGPIVSEEPVRGSEPEELIPAFSPPKEIQEETKIPVIVTQTMEIHAPEPIVVDMHETPKRDNSGSESDDSNSQSDSNLSYDGANPPADASLLLPELPRLGASNSAVALIETSTAGKNYQSRPPRPVHALRNQPKQSALQTRTKSHSQNTSMSHSGSEGQLPPKKTFKSNSVLNHPLPIYAKRPANSPLNPTIHKPEKVRKRKVHRAQTTELPPANIKKQPSPYDFSWSKKMLEKVFKVGVEVKLRPAVYLPDMKVRKLRKGALHTMTKALDLPELVSRSKKEVQEREFVNRVKDRL